MRFFDFNFTIPLSPVKSYSAFGEQSELTNRNGPRSKNVSPVLCDDMTDKLETAPSGTRLMKPIAFDLRAVCGLIISNPV